ncbi:PREDICTED: opsin-5-like [Poecilia mexicana]|uniref:opsin-5-like n=1 Tax=Poecilia mexicana TaxID=48701 RepID=UPI00072E109A|nr:PREDICTED: opsin-5-like [Poecilia mexicana]
MENTTWPYAAYVPHYLLRGDPFASRLSREADIIAAFYICIIGIMSATGNGFVIYMTIKRKTKLKPPELMIVNLAIFDFGISDKGIKHFVTLQSPADFMRFKSSHEPESLWRALARPACSVKFTTSSSTGSLPVTSPAEKSWI